MPFALHEYDAAFGRFFSQTMRILAQARSPLLAQMRFVEMPGTVGSRVRDRQGMDVVLDPGKTSTEVTSDLTAVRGLASVDAPAFEEVSRVVAGPFDVGLAVRQQSQIASVLLDVSATLDLRDVYADVRNDTLAVHLYPSVLLLADGPDQLSREGPGNWWDYNPDYAETIDGTAPAAPHLDGGGPTLIVPEERWWDLLAISAALRDRHFPTALRAAATA